MNWQHIITLRPTNNKMLSTGLLTGPPPFRTADTPQPPMNPGFTFIRAAFIHRPRTFKKAAVNNFCRVSAQNQARKCHFLLALPEALCFCGLVIPVPSTSRKLMPKFSRFANLKTPGMVLAPLLAAVLAGTASAQIYVINASSSALGEYPAAVAGVNGPLFAGGSYSGIGLAPEADSQLLGADSFNGAGGNLIAGSVIPGIAVNPPFVANLQPAAIGIKALPEPSSTALMVLAGVAVMLKLWKGRNRELNGQAGASR
jgi:hypothetical protein